MKIYQKMNKLLKIDSIMFFVKDLDKSKIFYQEVLSLKKVWEDKENKMIGFILKKSDSEIVIHSNPDIPNPDFSFLVKNVEEFCSNFKKKGYQVIKEPFDIRCGKVAILSDPDGNKIPIVDLTKFGGKPKYDN